MRQKYELVKPSTDCGVGRLWQVRALVDIPRYGVKAGDLGGFVENKDNLDQEGDCWIADTATVTRRATVVGDALVWGDAYVSDGACISGEAQVFGNAKIFDVARIGGKAKVFGQATVRGNASVLGDAKIHGNAWVRGFTRVTENADIFRGDMRCGSFGRNAVIRNSEDFMVFSNVGSELGTLTAYRTDADYGIHVTRGCFSGSLERFKKAVKSKHGKSFYAKQYKAIIKVIELSLS